MRNLQTDGWTDGRTDAEGLKVFFLKRAYNKQTKMLQ